MRTVCCSSQPNSMQQTKVISEQASTAILTLVPVNSPLYRLIDEVTRVNLVTDVVFFLERSR